MCQFYSCIVTESGEVLSDPMCDNHSEIIRHHKLDDSDTDSDAKRRAERAKFAKVEITPLCDDVFAPTNQWAFRVDESSIPAWWSAAHEKWAREELEKFLASALLIGKEIEELSAGRFWVKDCKIATLKGNALIVQLWGTSQVGTMWGTSRVGEMRGTSRVSEMRETSQVGEMNDNCFAIIRGDKTEIIVADKSGFVLNNHKPAKKVKS